MTHFKRFSLVFLVALACLFLGSEGIAQQERSMEPDGFPVKLTQRKAFQRWWWEFAQRAYPLDDIPQNARLNAMQQIEEFKAAQPPLDALVSGTTWVNIGPAPIAGGQIGSTTGARLVSGRVTAIAVDPTNTSHWLIGAAQGGVWETTNAGTNWTPKTDAQVSLAMGAIAFAPSNASIVYAGTGEANFSGDSYAGAGLLKSVNGGATWQTLAAQTFAKVAFRDIKVHPTDPTIVLTATARGRAGRVPAFLPAVPPRGIFKSTDGGFTWSQKLDGEATDLEIDPTNFNNQYAGIGDPFPAAANGVYRSTNGGDTWTPISGPWTSLPAGVGRVALALAPSDPNVLYVGIQDAFNSIGTDGGLLGLWKTTNAFATTPTWTAIPTGPTDDGTGVHGYCGWDVAFNAARDQCWYNHELSVDPANANTLYAGGIPLWQCTSCGASPTWTEVSKTASDPTNGIHVDQHALAWAGSRLIVGNDGGVWSTNDGGTSWADHQSVSSLLSITQFYDGSIHPTNPNFALGGSQDNGTEKWTGIDQWQLILGGDGADNAISSGNPDNHWAVSFQNLTIGRTTNGGASFIAADGGIEKTGVPFIARFEKCPANDNVFIAGTDNVWRINNFFTAVTPLWSDNLSGNFSSGISALAFAPSDTTCNTYAFGTRAGSLGFTANGGTTWVNIDVGNAVPDRAVTDLAFDPTNANILYVTLSGFDEGTPGQPGHIFKTVNALAASPVWTNVTPPVNIPENTIAVDPSAPGNVWVGSDIGVWMSPTGGSTWNHMGPEVGMPNVAVFELQINATTNRIVAFTHGRGAFTFGQSSPLNPIFSSVLPFSRARTVGSAATAFGNILNPGGATAFGCGISLLTSVSATFGFQATSCLTNLRIGTPNAPITIPAGTLGCFVFALTPSSPIPSTELELSFDCANSNPAPSASGLNTFLFLATSGPVADMVAVVGTLCNNGYVNVPTPTGSGVFSVATFNAGAAGTITATASAPGVTPAPMLAVCQTDPLTSVCLQPPSSSTPPVVVNSAGTPTFAVFVTGTGTIADDPAKNRVRMLMKDGSDQTVGATTVAVRTHATSCP